jgi:hypothetical protein
MSRGSALLISYRRARLHAYNVEEIPGIDQEEWSALGGLLVRLVLMGYRLPRGK